MEFHFTSARRAHVRCAGALTVMLCTPAGVALASSHSYYVSPAGNDGNSCSQAAKPGGAKKTIESGLSCLRPGSELILRPGTHTGTLRNLPDGSAAGGYVTIRAELDGAAIVTGGLEMEHTDAYLAIEGLRFHGSHQKNIRGNHLKIRRCEFRGGPDRGNTVNTSIGTNDFDDTADILIEDSWFHGPGGRYNLLVYNSDRIVVRRVLIRHDGGWTDEGTENPESGLAVYNSSDVHVQNVVVLDSDRPDYSTWSAPFYNIKNGSTPHLNVNNTWSGIIALNNREIGFRTDAQSGSQTFTDIALWDNHNGGMGWCCSSGNVTATINRATIGRSRIVNSGDFRGGFGSFSDGTKTVTNAIIYGLGGADLKDVDASHFLTFNNGSTSPGIGVHTYDARGHGLKHLARVENGSPLQSAGSHGGQLGARIVNRIGADGTLMDEPGWNAETPVALWPWPDETRIKKEMCTDAGVTRGFCGDSSITNYIWNYLDKANPGAR